MGIRKKEAPKTRFLTLGELFMISQLMPAFKTPTYGDSQRIDAVFATFEGAREFQQKAISEFYLDKNLPETETIDQNHPLAGQLNSKMNNTETNLKQMDIASYSLEDFNNSISGLNFTYAERKNLEFWLVKTEK